QQPRARVQRQPQRPVPRDLLRRPRVLAQERDLPVRHHRVRHRQQQRPDRHPRVHVVRPHAPLAPVPPPPDHQHHRRPAHPPHPPAPTPSAGFPPPAPPPPRPRTPAPPSSECVTPTHTGHTNRSPRLAPPICPA